MKIHEAQHGVEIIEGLPGSGKTFYAVMRVLRVIREQKRPVYTNLPLKHKVVRARLRKLGGHELANLLQPLTEAHWRAFLRRHEQYAELLEQMAKIKPQHASQDFVDELCQVTGKPIENIRRQHAFHSNQLRALFVHRNGPDVYEGPEANEIPAFAVICIDEVQNWHPMINQTNDPDRKRLLQYISKHRHSVHWFWVITQDTRNISIEFRRQAQSIWSVMQLGDVKLAWGLKFKHLRINATLYKRYTHEQYEMKDRNGDDRAETFILYTKLPWLQRNYRYYEPYTNSGTKRQLQKQLAKSRRKAGLGEDGTTQEEQMRFNRHTAAASMFVRKTLKRLTLVAVAGLAFVIGFTANKSNNGDTLDDGDTQTVNETRKTQRLDWPRWTIAGERPWIGEKKLSVGDTLANGARFTFHNPSGDVLVFVRDDDYWLWEYGSATPRRIGTTEQVQRAVQAARDDGKLASLGIGQSNP